jgi:osmotically-inducible protein OsmY
MTNIIANDAPLKKDITDKLAFEPSLAKAKIHIEVEDGVVTLFGEVNSLLHKHEAERAIKSIRGVKAVVNDLQVNPQIKYQEKSDTDIADAAIHILEWHAAIPEGTIQVTVEKGCITLTGEVDWWYQKEKAEAAIRQLHGIREIKNQITIRPSFTVSDVKQKIMEEFQRNISINVNNIKVIVEGKKVILQGKVHSWSEMKEAIRAAWSVPGVIDVENQLTIIATQEEQLI